MSLSGALGLVAVLYLLPYESPYLVPAAEWMERLDLFLQHPSTTIRLVLTIAFIPAIAALWGQVLVAMAASRLTPPDGRDEDSVPALAARLDDLRGAL